MINMQPKNGKIDKVPRHPDISEDTAKSIIKNLSCRRLKNTPALRKVSEQVAPTLLMFKLFGHPQKYPELAIGKILKMSPD